MKKLLLYIIVVMCSPIVFGSTPDYNINTDFELDVVNGDNDIGSLIFTRQQHIPEIITHSNFSTLTTQQYNILQWNGPSSNIIYNTNSEVLASGAQYLFTNSGSYTIQSLSNSSQQGVITVNSVGNPHVELEYTADEGIDISFSNENFVLNNIDTTIGVDVDIDDDLLPGEYEVVITSKSLSTGMADKTIEFDLVLQESKQWEIYDMNITDNIVAKTGDVTNGGFITLENIGNQNFDIELVVTGEGKNLVNLPSSQSLFKKTRLKYPIQIQVPSTFNRGVYPTTLTFKGGEEDIVVDINITIIDNLPPSIDEISFQHDYAIIDNEILVVAKDNLEVDNVTLSYDNKTFYFSKDQQEFKITHKFEKLSKYELNICAYDYDSNDVCVSFNKTFNKLNIINVVGSGEMPSVKFGKFARIPIFNLTEDVGGITLRLVSITGDKPNSTDLFTVRVIDGDGKAKAFSRYGSDVVLNSKGQIFLEVKANELIGYEGVLEFILPEYVENPGAIIFTGEFKEYDLPQSFTSDWYGDTIDCQVVDTGDLESSYFDCNVKLAVGTDVDDLPIPTTLTEKKQMEKQIQENEDEYNKKLAIYKWILGLLIGGILISGIIVWFVIYIFPYTNFAFNVKKSNNKYNNNKK